MNRQNRRAQAAQQRNAKNNNDDEMRIVTLGIAPTSEDPKAAMEGILWKAQHSHTVVLMSGAGPQISGGLTYDEVVAYAGSRDNVQVLLFVVGLESTRAYGLTRSVGFSADPTFAQIMNPKGLDETSAQLRAALSMAVENGLLTEDLALQALVLDEMDRAEPRN